MVYDDCIARMAVDFGSESVARQLTATELGKAARNVKRIEGYLVARCNWTLDPADRQSFDDLKAGVARLAFTIGQRTLALGIESRLTAGQAPEPAPQETFDGPQLGRFASFLQQLDSWFIAHPDAVPEPGAGRFLGEVQHSLEIIRQALVSIDENQEPIAPAADALDEAPEEEISTGNQVETPEAEVPKPLTPPTRAPSSAMDDDIYEGTRDKEGQPPPKPPEMIAFTASEIDPMFTWVGPESVDLTPLAKERVETLFEEQGVGFFRYQLENFADEIKKRIENAPEGHVLVVKVRTIGDERKPFLSYVTEAALAKEGH